MVLKLPTPPIQPLPIHRVFLGVFSLLVISLSTPLALNLSDYLQTSKYTFIILLFGLIISLWFIVRYKSYYSLGLLFCCISLYANQSHFQLPISYQQCQINAIPYAKNSYSTIKTTHYLKIIRATCKGTSPRSQTILLTEYNQAFDLAQKQGQLLHILADLKPIKGRINSHAWNKEQHYWMQNIQLQATQIKSIKNNSNPHDSYYALIQKSLIKAHLSVKHWINNKLSQHLTSDFTGFAQAIITGERNTISSQHKTWLQQTGTSHLLAISGMHLSIIGGLFWLLCQALWALSPRLSDRLSPIKAGAIASFFAITFYAWMTGFHLPVQRAWIMFSFLIVSWVCLKYTAQHSLLFAAIIVLLIFPKSILSISFYLSFLATYAVITIIKTEAPPLIKILSIQVGIYLILLPIIYYQFNLIPLTSLLANLLIIPWLSLLLFPLLILAIAYPNHDWISHIIWSLTDYTLNVLQSTLYIFNQFNGIIQTNHRLALWQVICAVICMMLAITLFAKQKDKKFYIVPFIIYCLMLIPIKPSPSPSIILSDNYFSKLLIHNHQKAIVINSGYKNQRFNDVIQWKKYLKQYNLSLSAIILQDDKISKISSTAFLKKHFPHAKIITLSPSFLPFEHVFCQSMALGAKFKIITKKTGEKTCQLSLVWEGESFSIFNQKMPNYIDSHGNLFIDNILYNSSELGEIKITQTKAGKTITTLRSQTSPWYGKLIHQ